jgi:formylglycine-generating enzyme required for sulfatase activity
MDVTDPILHEGPNRVLRGGSWCDHPKHCRSACRSGIVPGFHNDLIGCRVLLCLD